MVAAVVQAVMKNTTEKELDALPLSSSFTLILTAYAGMKGRSFQLVRLWVVTQKRSPRRLRDHQTGDDLELHQLLLLHR